MSSIEVRRVEPSSWDDLVRRFPDGTVFHRLPWLETLRAVHGQKIVLAQAVQDGACVGVWPALETRKGPLRVVGSPLPGSSTTYMGPLFRPESDAEAVLDAFLRHDLFHRASYLACRVIDRNRPVDLRRFGFSLVRKFPTYWIDLTQSEQALWAGLKSECRTQIRKAQKLGIEVRREETDEFVGDFWRMSLETFARSGTRPTHDERFVQELWNHLHPTGDVVVLSAFLRGERMATLVLPADQRALYYWGGASFQRHRRAPSHNLLHWEAMLAGKSRGLEGYDFISTSGGPGRFKRTFGPREIPMATHWERSSSRWTATLKGTYERYRRLRLGIPPRSVDEWDEDGDRVRVVHVISGLRMGGAETMLYKLLSHSDRREFPAEVVSLTDVGIVGERIADLGVRVRAIGLRTPFAAPVGILRLARWLRALRPDLVQTWLYHADFVGGLATRIGTGAPVLWNLRHSDFDGPGRPATGWTVAACSRLSGWLPARIVSCSEEARRLHVGIGYPEERMVVIPNGFDLERFRPDPAMGAAVREELGVRTDAPLVGLVGRYHPQKDHSTFLEAAARVVAVRPETRFLLCGPQITWENRELVSEIEAKGLRDQCLLLGRREDLPRIDAALDIACSSSAFGEGFSNVLGEAMACGVPCVATDVGDSGAIIADTGRTVPRRDPEAFAAALRELIDLGVERRRRLGLAARRRIQEEFSLSSVVRRYQSLYRQVAAERPRDRVEASLHRGRAAAAVANPRMRGEE